jgi:glycosyltransferase involved in cell wall biosynthesis
MHVLLISTGYPTSYQPLNGIFYYDQAKAIAKVGNKVGFLAFVPTSLKDFVSKGWKNYGKFEKEEDGVRSKGFIYLQIPKYFSQQFNKTLALGKKYFEDYIAKEGKPDIIHLHGFEGGKLAIWIQEKYGIPFVITEHSSRFLNNSLTPKHIEFAKSVFKNAKTRIAVSESFAAKLYELTSVSFIVIPNIVNTDLFQLGSNKKNFVFLSAGSFDKNKNQQLQILGFAKCAKDFPEAELWIAGDGNEKYFLESLILENKLQSKIKILGWLSREELRNRMKEASCFLISSKYESFGVVAIEAMSSGLPVISTPCGGPSSVIKTGENGIITDGTDNDYSLKMLEMLRDGSRYSSENIRLYAVNNFSEQAISKQLSDVYSQYI